MCTTIIIHNFLNDYPFILANNRDEFVDRSFSCPTILSRNPFVIGGMDLKKYGTWLGINQFKIVINILNKWKKDTPFTGSDQFKSRGTLVLNLLKESNIKNILNKLKDLSYKDYLPFYMIISDIKKVFFVEFDQHTNIIEISNQNFIAGNLDPFSKWDKFETCKVFFDSLQVKEIFSIRKKIKQLLKIQKGNFEIPSTDFSVNLGRFQTTSSTILEINKNKINYFFSNGKPLNTDYQNYSYLFKEY